VNLKLILNEMKKELGISEDVKVVVKPMKTKAASVTLGKNEIRINRNLLDLDEDCIRYLILHELTNIKLKTKYHTGEFYETIYGVMREEGVREVENKILTELLKINNVKVFID